jgi:hypothetical protein
MYILGQISALRFRFIDYESKQSQQGWWICDFYELCIKELENQNVVLATSSNSHVSTDFEGSGHLAAGKASVRVDLWALGPETDRADLSLHWLGWHGMATASSAGGMGTFALNDLRCVSVRVSVCESMCVYERMSVCLANTLVWFP